MSAVKHQSGGGGSLDPIADQTFLANNSGGTAVPTAVSASSATAMLSNMVGDSGSGGTKGLVPAPASGDAAAGKFLKADGTWAAGGGGAPTTAQYVTLATDGTLSAERVLTAGVGLTLTDGGAGSTATLDNNDIRTLSMTMPSTPAAGKSVAFWRPLKGIPQFGLRDENGVPWPLLQDPSYNNMVLITPGIGAPAILGTGLTTQGTAATPTFADTNVKTRIHRLQYSTGTTAGTTAGIRASGAGAVYFHRGSAGGQGGFYCSMIFAQEVSLNGGQAIVGLANSSSNLAGDPSAMTDLIGFGFDGADASSGNWILMRNDGSGTATRIDMGSNAPRSTTTAFLAEFACVPNDSGIWARLVNLGSNTEVLAWTQYTTDIPANTQPVHPYLMWRNAALSSNLALSFGTIKCVGNIGYLQ